MATTDVERLVVSLDASITKYERAMSKALGLTNSNMRKIEQRTQRMAGVASAALGRAFAVVGGGAALAGLSRLIDANTKIENSLKVAGLAGEDLKRVYDSLSDSARRNGASFEALTTLYGRAALVQNELGVSAEDLTKFTDNVALALRVAGTDAQSASGALLQLSQALGSGVVRAEEFNSILEGAPTIAQAAAAGITEAGGSVAKLRQLVIDGKVSSDVFFRGFQAGAAILQEKVATSTFTVSQRMEQLNTVLIKAAGQFDSATGFSDGTASALNRLAEAVENAGNYFERNAGRIKPFFDAIGEIDRFDPAALREALGLGIIDDFLEGTSLIEGRFGLASQQIAQDAGDIEAAIRSAIAAMLGFDSVDLVPDETQAQIDGLIEQMAAGELEAAELQQAMRDLGAQPLNFMIAIAGLGDLVAKLRETRGEAIATASAVAAAEGRTSSTNIDDQRYEQLSTRPRPAIQTVSVTESLPPGAAGSGGGGGQSPLQRFNDSIAAQEREIAALERKTQLQAQLNPLVNDYGFAMERLNAQLELENAANEAGLEITPQRQDQIDQLATGYAMATSEAARLAEAQNMVRQTADDMAQAGRQALDSIIDGFIEGKDTGELFNSVLKDLGKSLLNMGLNLLGSGGGFGSLLGGLFGGRGFAAGTANTGGMRGQPRGVVHGQEAVIPLPAGGNIPVDIRMPSAPGAAGQQRLEVHIVSDDEKFSAYVTDRAGQVVAQASPQIIGASVSQASKNAPASVAKYQRDVAGGDYRLA